MRTNVAAKTLATWALVLTGAAMLMSGCGTADTEAETRAEREVDGEAEQPQSLRVYIGTYTHEDSAGIYTAELDLATGELGEPKLAGEAESPSFLSLHPNGRWLYAVSETGDFGEGGTGAINAFAIDAETGQLTLLDQAASGGVAPCHIIVDRAGEHVLAANYVGGSAGAWAIAEDGSLGERTSFVQHSGSGDHPQRQQGPHAHAVELDAAGEHAFVPDLGANRVFAYRYDDASGELVAHGSVEMAPAAGPRHMRFHPSGEHAYVINELDSTVTVLAYDGEAGTFEEVQTLSTLPEDYDGSSTTAEVAVHPSGRFVYGANRGHDSLAVFAVDESSGELEPVGHVSTGGRTPRHFGIDPTGRWLIAANQNSDTLVRFEIDEQTGMPSPTGQSVAVSRPVCVMFARN